MTKLMHTHSTNKQETSFLTIFDCDGVLVDSEIISINLLRTILAEQDVELSETEAYDALLGKSVSTVCDSIKHAFNHEVKAIDNEHFQRLLFANFKTNLNVIPHVSDAIKSLNDSICVASSSNPERIAYSLELTGLLSLFQKDSIFSATMVKRGKPNPDLFLHAAQSMSVTPENCVVIEDSPAGVSAAKAAGMKCIAFIGASHAQPAKLQEKLSALQPDALINDMSHLKATITEIRHR